MKSVSRLLTAYSLLTYCVLSGCFHKDVMDDAADDVTQSFIYTGKDGPLIITQEQIFQATSKSSGGGFTKISGYNECRLTSYDLATGAMIGRVELGEEMESKCEMLGVYGDVLWCYSIDPEIGLHSRNPKTLEVVKKETDFSSLSSLQMARPEWSQITSYYAFDHEAGKIMLTDMQGIHHYFDPTVDTTGETESDLPPVDWNPDNLGSSVYFTEDEYISFDGSDDRKKLMWKYEDSTAELAFLKPSFIIDLNEQRAAQRKKELIDAAAKSHDSINEKLTAMVKAHPIFENDYASWNALTTEEREMRDDYYDLRRGLEESQRELDDLTGEFYNSNDYPLGDKAGSCLIYSASSVADTARAIISCVDVQSKRFTERWHLDLSSFYFDPNKAEGAGVFDEGDPEFGYRWADIHDGKLVMIAQLQMICIDMNDGKKLWQITL